MYLKFKYLYMYIDNYMAKLFCDTLTNKIRVYWFKT